MKGNVYILSLVFLSFITGSCVNDQGDLDGKLDFFTPTGINFVYEDGTAISEGDCISPDRTYAVQIEVVKNNFINVSVTKIEYTVNGAAYSMSFSEEGVKRNPIVLVEGGNIAELVKTAESASVNFVKQDDFQLVE